MVAQATQGFRHLANSPNAVKLAAVHGVPLQKFQTGSNRPVSPRLQPQGSPVGSPGPVTPMELESQTGGTYLTRGQAVPSPDAKREGEAISKALEAEEERKHREGRGSPTVQAGGNGF